VSVHVGARRFRLTSFRKITKACGSHETPPVVSRPKAVVSGPKTSGWEVGMELWRREWLRVGAAVSLLGGLLWLLAERDFGLPALLRSVAWALVVWVVFGLIWIGLEYGQRHEDAREQWSQINRVD
jgi:hypothetical protein